MQKSKCKMNVSLRDILNLVTRHGHFCHALRIATEFGLYHIAQLRN